MLNILEFYCVNWKSNLVNSFNDSSLGIFELIIMFKLLFSVPGSTFDLHEKKSV